MDAFSGITYIIVCGTILIPDLKEYSKSEAFFQRTNKVIWDITGATLSDIPIDGYINAIRDIKSLSRRNVRAAFIYDGDMDYRIGRMFKIYAELNQFPARINIFRNTDEAISWLMAKN